MANDPRIKLFEGETLEVSTGYTDVNTSQGGPAGSSENNSLGEWNIRTSGPSSIMSPDLYDNNSESFGRSYTVTTLAGKSNDDTGFVNRNEVLKDTAGETAWYDTSGVAKNPTTSNIIKWSENNKHRTNPYKFTDFVYAKHWNKIPNNRLITLRRFAYPIWDNLKFPEQDAPKNSDKIYHPIAQALAYIGEDTGNSLPELLNFTVGLNWGEATAPGVDDSIEGANSNIPGTAGIMKMAGILTGNADTDAIAGRELDPYKTGPYANKIYGPVNRIDKVARREAGLNYSNEIKITFSYIARPIDGVNTKAAMLDIMANLLMLTYAEAAFWGGEHRFLANQSGYPFIGGPSGLQSFRDGNPVEFMNDVTNQFAEMGENIGNLFGDFLGGDWLGALNNIAGNATKIGMAEAIKKTGINVINGLPALLTGSPVGEWHVVIGNPMNPIAMVGNLICKDASFEFGEELGPDDFPKELRVTVTLEHGMARDKAAVESVFNRGSGKIYALPDKLKKILDNSSVGINAVETGVDKKTEGNTTESGTTKNPNSAIIDDTISFGTETGKKITNSTKNIIKISMGKNNET